MKFKITSDLRQAKNIGAAIKECLTEIGVFTLADLEKMTSVEAFKKIFGNYPDKTVPVCYYLYSLEGALLNLHGKDIPSELKEELKAKIED